MTKFERIKMEINNAFNDVSISKQDCIDGLNELRDEIDMLLESLGE